MDDENEEDFPYFEETSQSNEENKVVFTTYDIELEIENCLTKKLSLKETIVEIESKFSCKLSDRDYCLVEDKYVDIIINFWKDEALQHISDCFDPKFPLIFIGVLNAINTFIDCWKIYGPSSGYNDLIKELAEKSRVLKSKEKVLILELKTICIAEISKRSHHTKYEINFIKMFEEILKYSEYFYKICLSLQVHNFLDNKVTFETYLRNLITNDFVCPKLNKLKRLAKKIVNNDKFFFVNCLKEMVSAYLKPVEIKETYVDGRSVLEVSGKRILLSKELKEMEKRPLFSVIQEVRFIKFSVLHIDANLTNSFWHGKNIVVFGETLIVSGKQSVTWDVSGKDADCPVSVTAGTSVNCDGLKGEDGKPGESGGNVFMLVESIQNSWNLNIISNGGKGSGGQSGRPGKKGENGKYIDGLQFKNNFPPVSHLVHKKKHYQQTIESVSQNVCSIDKFHYGQTELNVTKADFEQFAKGNTELNSIYFETTTKEGCKIIFSFYNENLSCCQSFLLYKGSLGKPGEIGEAGGLGGRGGFAGDISVKAVKGFNIVTVNAKNGENGKNGVRGKTGESGKSGLDRAYMDCTLASFFSLIHSEKWPKLFIPGPSDSNRLAVNFHWEKKANRVKCPYNNLYAEINVIKRNEQTVQSFQVTENYMSTQNNQHQEMQAMRKKNIPKITYEQYKEKDSLWSMCKIEDSLAQAQLMMEELINETLQQNEEITQAAKVTKQLTHSFPDWCLEQTESGTYSKNMLFKQEENEPPIKLKGLEVKIPRTLKSLLNSAISIPNKIMKSISIEVPASTISSTLSQQSSNVLKENTENASLSMYHLDALNKIDLSHFERLLKNTSNLTYSPCCVRFLDEAEQSIDNTPQDNYSVVESFFLEDSVNRRQEIVKICNDYSFNEEPLLEVLNSLVLEFEDDGNFETNVVECIHELKKCHSYFTFEKEFKLKEKLLPLKIELISNNENKHLYNLLLDSTLKHSLDSKIKFENKIAQDKFLSILYRKFVEELKKKYIWQHFSAISTKSFEDKILCVLKDFFMVKGPFSASFRELLSHYYEVNILHYTSDESNKMVLGNNHNPKASSKLHIVLKGNKFYKLNFDYDFARLDERLSDLSDEFNKIMFHLCSFADKQQVYDFYSKSLFNSNDYCGATKSETVGIKVNHVINQDNNVVTVSKAFKSQEDIDLIKCRLEKLKAEFIGYENILHYMALHFKVEGNHMTVEELCFVINQILKFSIEESQIMSVVSWKIAAKHQRFWVFELALLKLELYLKKPLDYELKLKWRKYIEHETEKNRLMIFLIKLDQETGPVSVEEIDNLLHLLSDVPKAHIGMEHTILSEWKYHLKDKFWAHQIKSLANCSEDELKTLSYYLITWENSVGPERCESLINLLKKHAAESKKSVDKKFIFSILKTLSNKEVCLNDQLWERLSTSEVGKWQKVIDKEILNTDAYRTLEQLVKLMQCSGNTSNKILSILTDIEHNVKLLSSVKSLLKMELSERRLYDLFVTVMDPLEKNSSVLTRIKKFFINGLLGASRFDDMLKLLFQNSTLSTSNIKLSSVNQLSELNLQELVNKGMFLPFVELCIELKHNIKLRDTQKLTVMAFLKNDKNTLAQVSTGEGKSLIVVATAIVKALSNQKVNIITSSKVLAKRDAEKYKDIYELCGLQVGHNCSEVIEERKKTYSNCQIIYGELANFQRDYLLDRVYNKNILGDCSFETVVVDEVDSMILDRGDNVLYLSHDIPGLDKLEPIFIYIWKLISRPTAPEQCKDVFNVHEIKEHIMYEIFGVLKKGNIKLLDLSFTDKQVDNTWQYLINHNIIDYNGNVLQDTIVGCKIDDLPESCVSKTHLKYLLNKVFYRDKSFSIPNYLKPFVIDHIDDWIKSGIKAISLENKRDYVVDVDRSGTSPDRNPIITILDRSTGTDLVNSQWDEALHQFLQLKHGCKLLPINLKAVFMSNVSFLKLYKTLYGLTGTLGSTCERESLREMYDVEFVTIPTAKVKNFSEESPIVCTSTDEWSQNIYNAVCHVINKQRSALIVCATIKDVSLLKERFYLKSPQQAVHTYIRDYERLNVAKELQPGSIIISTNLAGRGTDIKLSKDLIANGGLYVCLTFLPSNYRIEEQAYGRAARNGEPGTAQLVFRTLRQSTSRTVAKVIDFKRQRDMYELKRLAYIKTYHETQIQPEEKLFEKFCEFQSHLKQMKQEEDIKAILLQVFFDQWSFWLDKKQKSLSSSSSQDIGDSLKRFFSTWANLGDGDLEKWLGLIKDPTQLVKLGLVYFKQKDWKNALLLFDKVIEEEPHFSEIAYYFRVCVVAGQNKSVCASDLTDLRAAAIKIKNRAEDFMIKAFEVDWLKDPDHINMIHKDSFKEQQLNISNIYNIIFQSVQNIIGYGVQPHSFVIPPVGNHTAKVLYHNLWKEGLFTKPEIKTNIKLEELQFVSHFGLSPQKMSGFIGTFEGKQIQDDQFLKYFKRECMIPCRELFWTEMINNKALTEEEECVFIDLQELHLFHPSLCQRIKSNSTELIPMEKIQLYQPEELFLTKDVKIAFNTSYEFCQLIGTDMYKFLERNNILKKNKVAAFDPSKQIILNYFDSISKDDFKNVNICEETAKKIIEDLINQNIIKEKSSGQKGIYELLVSSEKIESIELRTHKAYTEDVISLMEICFAFRIAVEKLKLLLMRSSNDVCLPLQIELHETIVVKLKEKGIIKNGIVHQKKNVDKILDRLYPKCMNFEGYTNLLSNVCVDVDCKLIVEDLIEKRWLLSSNSFNKMYHINSKIKSLNQHELPNEDSISQLGAEKNDNCTPEPLTQHLDKETIMVTILNHLHLIENLHFIKNVLEQSKGEFNKIDTPSFSLTPLFDAVHKQKLTSEIEIFVLNGFDQVITLNEKKWTWKTNSKIMFIVIAGLCQTFIGVALQLISNPSGLRLAVEGMSDLIFAVRSICTGYCSFKSYLFDKMISMTITCFTNINVFRSAFGTKAAGTSFNAIKNSSKGLLKSTVGKETSVRLVYKKHSNKKQLTLFVLEVL